MPSSRRGRGEGSIIKRTDRTKGGQVRWVATLDLGWEGGKRRRRSVYGRTREEVAKALQLAQIARDKGLVVTGRQRTLEQFLEAWLRDVVKPTRRPKTYHSYESTVRLHVVPTLGRMPLAKLRPDQVRELLVAKVAGGMSPRTAQLVKVVLGTALNLAVKDGLIERNAAQLADGPTVEHHEGAFLTAEQARQLLVAAHGDPAAARLTALYAVALSLGLRIGEICGLCWQDVDLAGRELRVAHGLQRIEGRLQLVPTKTHRSRRVLVLPGVAMQALAEHQERQRFERSGAGARWQDSGHVFTMPTGAPIDPDHLRRLFKRLLKVAELPDMRFHDLRHSAASLLLAEGVPMRVIMETLGHSQIAITADLYSHVAPALQQEAADAMDRALGAPA